MQSLLAKIIYKLIIYPVFSLFIKVFALFHKKTRLALAGHVGVFTRLTEKLQPRDEKHPLVWFHVASVGEYLKIRPLIVMFEARNWQSVVTYSSSSAASWLQADIDKLPALLAADYLPLDSSAAMNKLLNIIQPDALVFLRYDLWPNLIWNAHRRKVPMLIMAAALHEKATRHKNTLARWFYIRLYKCFDGIYTITNADRDIYQQYHLPDTTVATIGDTGFDAVIQRMQQLPVIHRPVAWQNSLITVIGSHWPEDEAVILTQLKQQLETHPHSVLLFAPHEITPSAIGRIKNYFSRYTVQCWSELEDFSQADSTVFILDVMGKLSSMYRIADIAIVGGGFSTGVHNVMEPAVMHVPVLFGPEHHNAQEAGILIDQHAAFSFHNRRTFKSDYMKLLDDKEFRLQAGKKAGEYIEQHAGASQGYLDKLQDAIEK